VNSYTTDAQRIASVAMDSDGDFVVVWQSKEQDGSNPGIYAQRYNSSGTAQGTEFQVNTYTTDYQFNPSVAMDSDGDFVVTWMSRGQDGDNYGIYAQRYNSSGTAQGTEFQVNTYTTGIQRNPYVAIDSDGDFVIAWQSDFQDGFSDGIYAQRYNSSGTAQGTEFQVNTYTTNKQQNASVAIDSDGNFIVAWQSNGQDGDGYGIYAQRYNSSGTAQGTEFLVNTHTTNLQRTPSIAIDNDGDFVVAWESILQDGDSYGIYAQRYNSSGTAQGTEFRVNTYTTHRQRFPSIAIDSDGDFVVAWQSHGQDGSVYGIYAQQYNSSGTAQGSEFMVNTYTSNNQNVPSIAMDSDGDFVVAWQSNGQDILGYGIYAQRYSQVALPVELLSFSGKYTEGGNLLTWTTANEVNNKGFDIERLNGSTWESIGFKTANNKASNYQFLDISPPLGVGGLYYRLRQIDDDGTETFSKVISIAQTGKGKSLKLYPNPVSNTLTIEADENEVFQILNLLGQQVLTGKTLPLGVGGIDVSALPQGNYVLKVGAEQVKFVKQ
jgi:Secretion system C-terminal sorting domain